MTLEVEQQLVGIKDENGKAQWQPRPPKGWLSNNSIW